MELSAQAEGLDCVRSPERPLAIGTRRGIQAE